MASFKWDKTGLLQQVFYSELQVSSFFPAKDAKKVYTECTAAVLRARTV